VNQVIKVPSSDLAEAVAKSFPKPYSDAIRAKIGRNTSPSLEQTGHLASTARTTQVRKRAACTPFTSAFALSLGHLHVSKSSHTARDHGMTHRETADQIHKTSDRDSMSGVVMVRTLTKKGGRSRPATATAKQACSGSFAPAP
jgi:hypothetical protein